MSLKVTERQKPYVNIKTASNCKLIKDQIYTVDCPEASYIQPPVSILNNSLL